MSIPKKKNSLSSKTNSPQKQNHIKLITASLNYHKYYNSTTNQITMTKMTINSKRAKQKNNMNTKKQKNYIS